MLRWALLSFTLLLAWIPMVLAQAPQDPEALASGSAETVDVAQAEEAPTQPPADQPPAEQPPAEQPPAEQPPAPEPPAEQPAPPAEVPTEVPATTSPESWPATPTPEELFDPEELIRADEEGPPTPTPEPPPETPTPEPEPPETEPEPTPGVAVDEERAKEIQDLEALAQKYFNAMNYTRPPRNNVIDVSRDILAREPENAKVKDLVDKMVGFYRKKGEQALKAKQYAKAAENFSRLLQVDLFGANREYGEQQRDEALRLQGEAPPPKEKPDLLLKKAEDAFKRQDYQEARKFYQAILQQIPDDILARKGLEKCNQLLGIEPEGTLEERVAYFRQAGESFMEWGSLEEAKFYYEKILTLDPNDADAKAKLAAIQDRLTPKGKLVVKFSGAPFWWSTKVDGRISGEEAKAYIELVMKIDGETAYYRTDSEVEEPVASGKKGHAKNTYTFGDDYTFENVPAGGRTLEVIVRGGTGEETGQWTFSTPVQIQAGQTTELLLKTTEKLKYNKKKSRMTGDFKFSL